MMQLAAGTRTNSLSDTAELFLTLQMDHTPSKCWEPCFKKVSNEEVRPKPLIPRTLNTEQVHFVLLEGPNRQTSLSRDINQRYQGGPRAVELRTEIVQSLFFSFLFFFLFSPVTSLSSGSSHLSCFPVVTFPPLSGTMVAETKMRQI